MNAQKVLGLALLTFLLWTGATWLLEGRIETLLRPEARIDRAVYALVANLLVGILGAILVLRWFKDVQAMAADRSGFGSPARSFLWISPGVVLGLAFYWAQGAPSKHPVVIANAFAQVFTVSAAEVLVCWSLVARSIEAAISPKGKIVSVCIASVAASILFGVYHFAHSAPFNTTAMIALLSVIGLVTSAFFFVSRDVAATIVFHSFLGTLGVIQALQASGNLTSFEQLQASLLIVAAVTALALAGGYYWLRRPPAKEGFAPAKPAKR